MSKGIYRAVYTAKWRDPWHSELSLAAKVLFDYCITTDRQTACGVFEASVRQLAYETGIPAGDVPAALAELAPRVQHWPAHQRLFVRSFYRYQKTGPGFQQSAARAVKALPLAIQAAVGAVYPELGAASPPDTVPGVPPPSDPHTPPVPCASDRRSAEAEADGDADAAADGDATANADVDGAANGDANANANAARDAGPRALAPLPLDAAIMTPIPPGLPDARPSGIADMTSQQGIADTRLPRTGSARHPRGTPAWGRAPPRGPGRMGHPRRVPCSDCHPEPQAKDLLPG
jgi:hypothetical protein